MDVMREAEKMKKALCEIDILLSEAAEGDGEILIRLRAYFTDALNQIVGLAPAYNEPPLLGGGAPKG